VSDLTPTLLAIAVLAAALLIGVGGRGLMKPGANRLKSGLMVGAGLVTLFNVWIGSGFPGLAAP
jgi:hypothetical protein